MRGSRRRTQTIRQAQGESGLAPAQEEAIRRIVAAKKTRRVHLPMPLKTHHDDDMPAINLTPMLDIVFNLMIFFMVGTRFAEMEQKVDVKVPSVKSSANLPPVPEKRLINVYRDGALALDGQTLSLPELTSRLADDRRQNPQISVTVRGDSEGAFQHVASVLTACRQAGISDLGISVRQQKKVR